MYQRALNNAQRDPHTHTHTYTYTHKDNRKTRDIHHIHKGALYKCIFFDVLSVVLPAINVRMGFKNDTNCLYVCARGMYVVFFSQADRKQQ